MALDQPGLEMLLYKAFKDGFATTENPDLAQRKLAKDISTAIIATIAKLQVQTVVTVATPAGPGAGTGTGGVL